MAVCPVHVSLLPLPPCDGGIEGRAGQIQSHHEGVARVQVAYTDLYIALRPHGVGAFWGDSQHIGIAVHHLYVHKKYACECRGVFQSRRLEAHDCISIEVESTPKQLAQAQAPAFTYLCKTTCRLIFSCLSCQKSTLYDMPTRGKSTEPNSGQWHSAQPWNSLLN
jgi:hypothetical protein